MKININLTAVLIAINIIIFIIQLYKNKYNVGPFLSIFTHANIAHLVLNMISLYQNGSYIENTFGPTTFIILFISSGIIGNYLSKLMNEYVRSIGSSGAISGLVGAKLIHLYNINKLTRTNVVFEFLNIIGKNLLNLDEGIDVWAYIGGLLFGAVLLNTLLLSQ